MKTTMRYHLMPVRMAIIKKTKDKSVGEDVQLKKFQCTIDGDASVVTVKNSMEVPPQIKSRTSI